MDMRVARPHILNDSRVQQNPAKPQSQHQKSQQQQSQHPKSLLNQIGTRFRRESPRGGQSKSQVQRNLRNGSEVVRGESQPAVQNLSSPTPNHPSRQYRRRLKTSTARKKQPHRASPKGESQQSRCLRLEQLSFRRLEGGRGLQCSRSSSEKTPEGVFKEFWTALRPQVAGKGHDRTKILPERVLKAKSASMWDQQLYRETTEAVVKALPEDPVTDVRRSMQSSEAIALRGTWVVDVTPSRGTYRWYPRADTIQPSCLA